MFRAIFEMFELPHLINSRRPIDRCEFSWNLFELEFQLCRHGHLQPFQVAYQMVIVTPDGKLFIATRRITKDRIPLPPPVCQCQIAKLR